MELEDKEFKQFLLKLLIFQTILRILRQEMDIETFPDTTTLQDSFMAQHQDYFTRQYVHHIKSTHKTQLKQGLLSPIRQRLFQLNTPAYHRRSKGGGCWTSIILYFISLTFESQQR